MRDCASSNSFNLTEVYMSTKHFIVAFAGVCVCCFMGCTAVRSQQWKKPFAKSSTKCGSKCAKSGKECQKCQGECPPPNDCRCYEPKNHYSLTLDDFCSSCKGRRKARKSLKPCSDSKQKLSCDFKSGYQQGYVDVAKGYSGKTPPIAPPKYWKHHYRSGKGRWRAEQWFEGYASGVESAYAEGLNQSRYVAASQVDYSPCNVQVANHSLQPAYSQIIESVEPGPTAPIFSGQLPHQQMLPQQIQGEHNNLQQFDKTKTGPTTNPLPTPIPSSANSGHTWSTGTAP